MTTEVLIWYAPSTISMLAKAGSATITSRRLELFLEDPAAKGGRVARREHLLSARSHSLDGHQTQRFCRRLRVESERTQWTVLGNPSGDATTFNFQSLMCCHTHILPRSGDCIFISGTAGMRSGAGSVGNASMCGCHLCATHRRRHFSACQA